MTRHAAVSATRRRPDEHPDSVIPDDDTVRDEESTPLDHASNEVVEDVLRSEREAEVVAPRRRTR